MREKGQIQVTDVKVLLTKLFVTVCRFLPDKNNRFGYLTLEHSGIRFRACPYGTEFSARQCGCTWIQFTAYQNPRKEGNRR